jgi:hypothetical protein
LLVDPASYVCIVHYKHGQETINGTYHRANPGCLEFLCFAVLLKIGAAAVDI